MLGDPFLDASKHREIVTAKQDTLLLRFSALILLELIEQTEEEAHITNERSWARSETHFLFRQHLADANETLFSGLFRALADHIFLCFRHHLTSPSLLMPDEMV